MNKNVEVINDYFMAVHFRFIPFISEIEYIPHPFIPKYEEPGFITTNGILLLNKDHQKFSMYKSIYPEIMQKSEKKINKELESAARIKTKTDHQIIYTSMLEWELARRNQKKAVEKPWGQSEQQLKSLTVCPGR